MTLPALLVHQEVVVTSFSPEVTAVGTVALIQGLVRHLAAKGLIDDAEWTVVLNDAAHNASTRPDGKDVIAFLMEVGGTKPKS